MSSGFATVLYPSMRGYQGFDRLILWLRITLAFGLTHQFSDLLF
jgi:hypothetical protein